jgi:transposase
LAAAVIPRGFLNQLGFAMWTPATRRQHSRIVTRYQTDLTDAEWRVPRRTCRSLARQAGRASGRCAKSSTASSMSRGRAALGACCRTTCPRGAIYRWFAAWCDDGRFERINHAIVMADRERVGRDASPSAAIIDSQPRPAGHAVRMLERRSTDASAMRSSTRTEVASCSDRIRRCIQDRDGGQRASGRIFPFIRRVFADSGYAGEKVAKATLIAVEIVRKNPDQQRTSRPPSTPRAPCSVMLLVRRIARAS